MLCKQLENLEIIYDDIKKHKSSSNVGKLLEFTIPELFKNKKFKSKLSIQEYNDLLLDEILNYIIKNSSKCKKRKSSIISSLKRRSTIKYDGYL